MHSHCADCTVTVPKILHRTTCGVGWRLGWSMLHVNCMQLIKFFLQWQRLHFHPQMSDKPDKPNPTPNCSKALEILSNSISEVDLGNSGMCTPSSPVSLVLSCPLSQNVEFFFFSVMSRVRVNILIRSNASSLSKKAEWCLVITDQSDQNYIKSLFKNLYQLITSISSSHLVKYTLRNTSSLSIKLAIKVFLSRTQSSFLLKIKKNSILLHVFFLDISSFSVLQYLLSSYTLSLDSAVVGLFSFMFCSQNLVSLYGELWKCVIGVNIEEEKLASKIQMNNLKLWKLYEKDFQCYDEDLEFFYPIMFNCIVDICILLDVLKWCVATLDCDGWE
ncbi:hypothetical protein VP01_475g1 [Puccinia sorghi]|uniref:Uncharacterized protein n=1 Tax=Puccinia sorghi TaxID=27349 RepID=A0A0L6UMQ4_9BASI|nr:hypothetical protein VP01_475g1 [Puccinia sorghi]